MEKKRKQPKSVVRRYLSQDSEDRRKSMRVDDMSLVCQEIAEELLSSRTEFQFDSANKIFTTSMGGFEGSVIGTPGLYISVEENEEVVRVVVSSNVMAEVVAFSGGALEMEVLLPELAYFAHTSSPFGDDEVIQFRHGLECDEDFIGPCVEITFDQSALSEEGCMAQEFVFEYVDIFEQLWMECVHQYRRNAFLRDEFKGNPILAACGLDTKSKNAKPTNKRKEGRVYH